MVKVITSLNPPKTFTSLHLMASYLLLPTGDFSVLLNSLYLYMFKPLKCKKKRCKN